MLCGTPGRLLYMIGRGKVGLTKVRYLVLDEADCLLDTGFEPEMRRLVGSPGMPSKENRQTLMFSATFPEDVQSDMEQTFVQANKDTKKGQLIDLLKSTGSERTIVFVESRNKAEYIATFLCQKFPTASIHRPSRRFPRG